MSEPDDDVAIAARRLTKAQREALLEWPERGLGKTRCAAPSHGISGLAPSTHRRLFDAKLTIITDGTRLTPLGLRVRAALAEMEGKE